MATGNNVKTSLEIARRMLKIEMDAKMSRPWTRNQDEFKHENLTLWIKNNREKLINKCLTIIQGWIAEGMPKCDRTIGKYESWSKVIGGILEYTEIEGFLEDLDKMYEEIDKETEMWKKFLEIWWDKKGNKDLKTAKIWRIANNHDLLLPVLGDGSDRSQTIKLGKELTKMEGRIIGDYKITKGEGNSRSGSNSYKLENLNDDEENESSEIDKKDVGDEEFDEAFDDNPEIEGLGDDEK